MSFTQKQISIPLHLQHLYLTQQQFTKRFIKQSRFQDPYVRVFEVCVDSNHDNSRVAIKDYSAVTKEQKEDVTMNLQSYLSLREVEGICKIIAFCFVRQSSDIKAAFEYTDSSLEELMVIGFLQDDRNQFYLFILKELLFVYQNVKAIGVELQELILSNILVYKQEGFMRVRILFDEREKRYDKVLEGLKVYSSTEAIRRVLGQAVERHQEGGEFVFQLGLLLLDLIYFYQYKKLRSSNVELKGDISFKGYYILDGINQVRLDLSLIEQKKQIITASRNQVIYKLMDLIEKMIVESAKRISLGELAIQAELLTIHKDHSPRVQIYSSSYQQISPVRNSSKVQDSLKYSENSQKMIHKNFITFESNSHRNVFVQSKQQLQSRSIKLQQSPSFGLLPRKLMNQRKASKQVSALLQKFIGMIQSRSSSKKKQYLDNSVYFGQIDGSSLKRQGYGIYFYSSGDVYFGNWKENVLIEGIYIFKNGESFEGTVKNGKQGWGKYQYANGNLYEGQWKDDLKCGRGKMTYFNGQSYDGMWVKGKKNGEGIYYYRDGSYYKGNFVNGKKCGQGSLTFSNHTRVQAFWQQNHVQGRGKIYYNNGHYYEGEFSLSQKDGQGLYKWQDQTRYQGQFRSDHLAGDCRIKYIDNEFYEGRIQNGKREGFGIYRYPNGDEFKGEWKNDEKLIGQYKFSDGRSFDGRFKKNQMSYGVLLYQNGDSYEGQFSNGQRHGIGLYRNAAGEILHDGKWVKDKFASAV